MPRIKIKSLGISKKLDRVYDSDEMVKERQATDSAIDEKLELGEKFETDKNVIDEKIAETESSADIPAKDKRRLLEALYAEREKLKKDYDEKVTEKTEELIEKGEAEIEQMSETAEKFGEQEAALREIKSESGGMDLSSAADEAAEKKQQFEKNKEEAIRNLDLKIQQLQIQQRNMRANRLRKGK